ncbi:RNase H-like domain found in reverse transcriptase [Popillia japonica]|uniref:RNase H-like domain found in reverse transcriptase n=1 Tax=Popillia japonica TaxID=7064 RepID=A0AAW1KJJ7_POPJA
MWTQVHTDTVNQLKELITDEPTLAHFNGNLPAVIEADASMEGFGCCLIQEGKVVAYSSRSLTDAEKRYANIEGELSAIVFAAEKFHFYIYGKEKVVVKTDHAPLVCGFKGWYSY